MHHSTPLYNIAHRGARSLAPENTMAAFHKAWQVGAHGIETDISLTADGTLIIFHDATLLRTTDVDQVFPQRMHHRLHTFSWRELQMLDAGSWFLQRDPFDALKNGSVTAQQAAEYKGLQIPQLEETLVFIKEKSWFVNLEIKPHVNDAPPYPIVEKILQCIDDIGLAPHMFSISSFFLPFLHKIKKLRPEVEVNALIGEDERKPHDWEKFQFDIYNANVKLIDLEQLRLAKKNGCRVNLYTVNDASQMRYYLQNGVEKIITDFPQLLTFP